MQSFNILASLCSRVDWIESIWLEIKKTGFLTMRLILYSYFMPVCSIVKTITPRCRGRPDALLHEAE